MNRFHHIIQVKTVVLIGILALVRKFIIVNIETVSATTNAALAFALIAFGALNSFNDNDSLLRRGRLP
jgi:uncharacterized membrane protein (DUF373 family)